MQGYVRASALLAWLAVSCEWYAVAGDYRAAGQGLLAALVHYAGFFTVLTNVFCALVLTVYLMPGSTGVLPRWLRQPAVITSAQVSIAGVMAVYHLMLRQLWNPVGVHALATFLLHYAVPLAYSVFWWRVVPRGVLGWRDLAVIAIYPAAYGLYVFLRGEMIARYPYPFFDITRLGYPAVAINAAAIFAALMVLSVLLILLKRQRAHIPS